MICQIVIPTFQRAHQIGRAITAALGQTHGQVAVTVVDDGSTDGTRDACAPYFDHPAFTYIALDRNCGTAAAKNVGLLLTRYDAISFHDSDDIPHPDKLLRQARTLARADQLADPCLPWHLNPASTTAPNAPARIDIALTAHRFIAADGSSSRICRTLSLVDDFFPNLQFGTGPLGDWVLINSGLFRRDVFQRIGGYRSSIEEDRDLRNRALIAGLNLWVIDQVLLTKYDEADSLTAAAGTGYRSARRHRDRQQVWQTIADWRAGRPVPPVPVDLDGVGLAFVSNPAALAVAADIPATDATRARLQQDLEAMR